jgi:peptidoglycan hydrolase-like protein with peptidoglycan-binding domain
MKRLLIALAASAAVTLPALAQSQQTQPGPMQPQAGQQREGIAPRSLSADQVRQIQDALKSKGHYKGQVDGVWGPGTASAMRRFSAQQGGQMPRGGGMDRISPHALTALGLDPAQFSQRGASPDSPGSPPSTSPGAPPSGTQPGSPDTSPGMKPDSGTPDTMQRTPRGNPPRPGGQNQ